jgi:hypothetical protein
MKAQGGGEGTGIGKRVPRRTRANLTPIPMEWMDPMSWRLPSGKALAEFALQAGFLAPLLLSGPVKRPKKAALLAAPPPLPVREEGREEPERPGAFRQTR